jgi:hypothetical protein
MAPSIEPGGVRPAGPRAGFDTSRHADGPPRGATGRGIGGWMTQSARERHGPKARAGPGKRREAIERAFEADPARHAGMRPARATGVRSAGVAWRRGTAHRCATTDLWLAMGRGKRGTVDQAVRYDFISTRIHAAHASTWEGGSFAMRTGEPLKALIHVLGQRGRVRLAAGVGVLALIAGPAAAQTQALDNAITTNTSGNAGSLASQERINAIADDTEAMASSYRASLEQIESLRVYNNQLSKLIRAQEDELASLDEQVGEVTVIGREMTPLMLRMIDALEAFVDADVPMLLNERHERIAGLRELMDRADIADSEKYRRITEAYQIENEYGRTIEAYQDDIEINGETRTLEMLRIGRIALLYRTLDGSEAGAWDQRQHAWVELPSEYRDNIRKGVRIAHKQAAPDLIRLPVLAPEEAK